MASSAIANAFSGFLKGWDNETDRQTRQADAAEARTRNAEMFGLQKQALQFNLQDMERKSLLGSAQLSTQLGLAQEAADTFTQQAPTRLAQRDLETQALAATQAAKQRVMTSEVMQDFAQQQAQSNLQGKYLDMSNALFQKNAQLFETARQSITPGNAAQVMTQLGLDNFYQLVPMADGTPGVKPRNGGEVLPLGIWKELVLNDKAASQLSIQQARDMATQQGRIDMAKVSASQKQNRMQADVAARQDRTRTMLMQLAAKAARDAGTPEKVMEFYHTYEENLRNGVLPDAMPGVAQ
jgi:hypothetical protein